MYSLNIDVYFRFRRLRAHIITIVLFYCTSILYKWVGFYNADASLHINTYLKSVNFIFQITRLKMF